MDDFNKKKIQYLIVDTSAFLKNAPLLDLGVNIITVPEVVHEIKNKRQLRRLVVLPYDLQIKNALPDNIKFVNNFSKKTGDFPSLSATDINVIALTYQLEKELNGIKHLNTEPLYKPLVKPSNSIPENLTNIAGFYLPKNNSHNSRTNSFSQSENLNEDLNYESDESDMFDDAVEELNIDNESEENNKFISSINDSNVIEKNLKNLSLKSDFNDWNSAEKHAEKNDTKFENTEKENFDKNENEFENLEENVYEKKSKFENLKDRNAYEKEDEFENSEEENVFESENDDCDWITPSNINDIKNKIASELDEDLEGISVACLTTDFAMQNVLKQIGLHVVSLDGKLIKQLRTFILRCYGCFKTTSVMTKIFCPNCGNKTLKKVAVSLDSDGMQHIHINFKKPLTARGKRYSLPRFKGGKHSNNPIICEDQPMPQQNPSRLSKTKNNPLNDEYIAGYSPFVMRDITSKSAMLGIKPHIEIKHQMRRNPNERRKFKK